MNDQATLEQAIEALYATGHWLLGQCRHKDAADVFRTMVNAQPEDERGWLGLGQAHEGANQKLIAREMYLTGVTIAHGGRCAIALSRILGDMGQDAEAAEVIDFADAVAKENDDEALAALVSHERGVS
jgi:hypothetical protein